MEYSRDLPYPPFSLYLKSLSPKYIIPDLEVKTINDISPVDLKQRGIKAIIFDVDNTICPYHGTSVDERVKKSFIRLTQNLKCCILSNTNPQRMANLESYFGIPVIQTKFRKPLPESFNQAINFLQVDAINTAMIGDRLLSDIAGANMAGLFTIKVNPLERSSEPFAHTIARTIENLVYKFYRE